MVNIFKKYTCIKQQDIKDCGAACLATISKQYGLKFPISKIREVAGTDKNGTSAYGLVKAAESLGFSAKGVKAQPKEQIFEDFPLPAIAHVVIDNKLLHYVVIHKITKKEIVIADPESGIVKYKPEDFFEIWTGILIVMIPTEKFQKGNEVKGLFARFFHLLKPQKKLVINTFIASVIITVLGILGSFYFKFIVDDILPYNLNKTLHIISFAIVTMTLFKAILETFRKQLLLHLSQKLDIPLMLGYYNHVIELPMSFFGTREVGEIISRFNDSSKIREAISGATLTIMIDTIMVIVGGIILYMQNKMLFTITLIPLFLYAIFVFAFNRALENVNRQTMQDNASLTSYLVESLNGIETVKAFNSERQVNLETEKRFIKLLRSIFKNGFINNVQESLKVGTRAIFGVVLIWIGSSQVMNGNLSMGELLAFNALLVYFLNPIENLINLQPQFKTAVVAAERLGEILDLELEKGADEERKIKPENLNGDIEFKDVSFRYGTRQLILEDLNLHIKSGEKIALVGESGSGKTTLIKLLLNFYQVEEGEVLINGYNINDINIEALRDKISYISQETFLFRGTIKENLEFGNDGVEFEDMIEACKRARVHDFINKQQLRYQTYIEEGGSNLSGGQKQRLAIARAILRKPDILIMDEATSNLDSITEKAIEKTMHEFSEGTTTIMIAHRLSTIMRCDKIYVMEKGTIIEGGTHSELIEKRGAYFKFWKDQLPDNIAYDDAAAATVEKEEGINETYNTES
ncbi:MAG: peptidase domain-containing ABC transporter [Firmicutes bacterium]|nr:peptidase domain-containing ABC transporter [Bacillota bacterium]